MDRKYQILLVCTVLILASLACNMPGLNRASTPEPVVVSTEALEELEKSVEEAAQALMNGQPVTLTVTEAQLTSAAAINLQQLQDPQIHDIQIRLRDGQIQVSGKVEQNGINLPLKLSVRVFASGQGGLSYEVVEAAVGPIPLPDGVLNQLSTQLDQLIYDQISQNIYIETITITDGAMTISGKSR